MHQRLSVSGLCFPRDDLGVTVDRLEEVGATSTTIQASKLRAFGWDAGLGRLAGSSVRVAGFVDGVPTLDLGRPDTWDTTRTRMIATVDAAAQLGARVVYVLTGRLFAPGGGSAPWVESADAFVAAIEPVATHARSSGVQLAVEPTSSLYADFNIVHSLADAALLLDRCDLGVCLDLLHVWTEARLEERIADLAGRIALVQLADQAPDHRSLPNGVVPGDGMIPLRRALRAVLDAGYDGPIDLELCGPAIDAEGEVAAIRRAVAWLEPVLVELGLPAGHPIA